MSLNSNDEDDCSTVEDNKTVGTTDEQISSTGNPSPKERKRKCADEIQNNIPPTSVVPHKSPAKTPKIINTNVKAVLPKENPMSHVLQEHTTALNNLMAKWRKILSENEDFEERVIPSSIDDLIKAGLLLEEELKKQKENVKGRIALFAKAFQKF